MEYNSRNRKGLANYEVNEGKFSKLNRRLGTKASNRFIEVIVKKTENRLF